MQPTAPSVRHQVEPRDLSPEKVARRLGMTLAEFLKLRDKLYARGLPKPDPDTGNTPIEIVDSWRLRRYGRDVQGLTDVSPSPQHDPRPSMGERFRAATGRLGDG